MRFWLLLLVACSSSLSTSNKAQNLETAQPWVMHTVTTGQGADGVSLGDVDGDGDLDIATPWEQGAQVTVSLNPGDGSDNWQTVVIASGSSYAGLEDAIFADVDGDGRLDVISANENGKRVVVHFAPTDPADILTPSAWVNVTITASVGVQRVMQLEFADLTGDGVKEIVVGGKVQPATIGYYQSGTPRDGSSWVYTPISAVSWTMTLDTVDMDGDGDLDVVVSDRDYLRNPLDYSLMGERWLENPSWVNHGIGTRDGDRKFMDVQIMNGILTVTGGRSSATVNNVLTKKQFINGLWVSEIVTAPTNFGRYHDVVYGDIDADGVLDRVYSASSAGGSLSGILWVSGATGQRGEVSGILGDKYDNVELLDVNYDGLLDIVTSEQNDQLGVVWFANPFTPPPPPPVPDAALPDAGVCLCPCACQ